MKAQLVQKIHPELCCHFCGLMARVAVFNAASLILPENAPEVTTDERLLHLCWRHACGVGIALQELGVPASKPPNVPPLPKPS